MYIAIQTKKKNNKSLIIELIKMYFRTLIDGNL